jgi:hypothetical protein
MSSDASLFFIAVACASCFTLIIHGENNSEVLATFRRYGLSWKLSNIKLQDL